MPLRDMYRTDWKRILKRDYTSRECLIGGKPARESLIVIRDITAPMTVSSAGEAVKIVEKDYSWLQIAQDRGRWWLTAMFDERNTLLQIYFDITDGNRFDTPDNPAFRDMYLDVVMLPDGRIVPLDEDELTEALQRGEITQSEHDRALSDCAALCAFLRAHTAFVLQECASRQRALRSLLRA